jgi:hypothetical protein
MGAPIMDKPALIRIHTTAKVKSRFVKSANRLRLTLAEYLILCAEQYSYFDDEPPKKPPPMDEQ